MTLSIGEVAAHTGLRPSALRYYEEIGLIHSVGRRGGRRYFDIDVLSRLRFIALSQSAGFTLEEIATLLDGRRQMRQRWRRLAEAKLGELDRRMGELRGITRLLEAALACTCARVEGCELVEEAAERRRVHRKERTRPVARETERANLVPAAEWPRVPYVGVGCIVVHGGRVLLVRNKRGLWSTPGGHLDFGEDPAAAALCETAEETGVSGRSVEFVAITNDVLEPDGKHYITIWMRAEAEDSSLAVADTAEIHEAAWFDPSGLPEPRHAFFDNLLSGRTLPPAPRNLPFRRPGEE